MIKALILSWAAAFGPEANKPAPSPPPKPDDPAGASAPADIIIKWPEKPKPTPKPEPPPPPAAPQPTRDAAGWYHLQDKFGQDWTWTDPNWLKEFVGKRNRGEATPPVQQPAPTYPPTSYYLPANCYTAT